MSPQEEQYEEKKAQIFIEVIRGMLDESLSAQIIAKKITFLTHIIYPKEND